MEKKKAKVVLSIIITVKIIMHTFMHTLAKPCYILVCYVFFTFIRNLFLVSCPGPKAAFL